MDSNLVVFITKMFERATGQNRQELLLDLRDKPEILTGFIEANLHGWSMFCASEPEIGQCVLNLQTLHADALEVVEHLKRRFAGEIEALPASVPAVAVPNPV